MINDMFWMVMDELSVIPAFELMLAIKPKDRVIIVRTGLRPG